MSRVVRVIATAVLVALLYAALTAVVPMGGLEGLLLLALLVTITVVVVRLRSAGWPTTR